MLKPNKTFKLSKQTKRFMATFVNAEDRNAFKRAMIDAELCSAVRPTREKKSSGPQGN